VPVPGDGTLLERQSVTGSLPVIALAQPLVGTHLQQPWALGAARLLAAAPRRLLPRLTEVMTVTGHGLVVQIRNGPSIYFGDPTRAQAKWNAVVAVLADAGSAGAEYIDVTDPARPAAGGGAAASSAENAASASSATAASTSAGTSAPTVASSTPATAAATTSAAAANPPGAGAATSSGAAGATPSTGPGSGTSAATSGG